MVKKRKKIILGVTGSIAAYKSAELIRRLQDHAFDVSVIMTKEAENFISALTLSTLSGKAVYRDMFAEEQSAWQMNHIQLAKDADAFLIAPATANIISKLACGLADDLLTCTALTIKAPILIVPAMNNEMYANKIVQSNCKKLKEFGFHFVEPIKGNLACGVYADGHLADVENIVETVKKITRSH